MTEFLTVLVEHLSVWTPSIVAVLTIIATIIPMCLKIREYLKSLKEDKTLIEISNKLKELATKEEEIVRCEKLLLDQMSKIKGYADLKKED